MSTKSASTPVGFILTRPAPSVPRAIPIQLILTKDLSFNSYSTFAGKVDWKFTHKNHFYVVIVPLWTSRTTTLSRDIVWAGNPIHAGAVVQSELHAFEVAPGYQYDIIRRRRGHLGLAVQFDLFHTYAKIAATAQVTGDGTHQAAVSASRTLWAPIPVAGPQFRLYLSACGSDYRFDDIALETPGDVTVKNDGMPLSFLHSQPSATDEVS
jgi:hypothetical protein